MAHPTTDWLLEPTFPAPPALPRLDRETSAVPAPEAPRAQYPSGTWLVGSHADAGASLDEQDTTDSQRFAKSDSEAPTVRPGALRALKKR
ncbi:MAG TPA: hypothetical protein VFK05_10585 [Polyangiaceae bacterium]|nr:hypothetical protein [Polyangiaceae bacterium]